jgi:hypothetical protein
MVKIVFRKSLIIGTIILFVGASVLPIISSGYKNIKFDEISNCENCDYYQKKYGDNTEFNAYKVSNIYQNNLNNDDYLDQYNHEDDGMGLYIFFDSIDAYQWVAQSFIPIHPVLTRVKLLVYRWDEPWCDLVMSIRDDLNETDLVTLSKNYVEIPEAPGSWVEFDFPDISVDVGEEYYIVCTSSCGMFQGESYFWMFGENTSYDGGDAWWKNNYTDEWGTDYFKDCCFETYGYGGNQQPIANFTWTPKYPDPGETVIFDATSSYDPDGTIDLYEWDWDNDGIFDESHNISTTNHLWLEIESIPITLRVTDNGTANTTVTKMLHSCNPHINIDSADGGFRVRMHAKNIENETAYNVSWSIDLEGGIIFVGRHNDGVINEIAPGESVSVGQTTLFGIGRNVVIIATVECDSRSFVADWVLGPLVLGMT